ncbi:Glutamate--cysteine ligase catalytic subunit [Holothuria leucospilota]|uniref:Glutamate--cysteine ligase n=1 Tax=Holothuria leucospilota TaxID=206669 RepID=A0A9Q1BYL1_HOLLE|nr:Glutamate--cysteine ligase catalytic subunit [Holothuria leucospilota]
MCRSMFQLALSAASPVFRGFLSDLDCRWNAVSASLDSMNREERGLEPLKESKFVIPKAKFDTVSFYLSAQNESLNDVVAPIEESTFQKLVDGGVDVHLARHISYILIRDPMILYEENIHQNVEEETEHFDVQLTDFENAAYAIFVMLLVRAIDKFKLDIAAPISKVDSNMKHAHAMDALCNKTFFFKTDVESRSGDKRLYTQMSIDVIINGGVTSSGTEFPGLIPVINRYISTVEEADGATCATISHYLRLISDRAAGRVNTTARWIRNVVKTHPDYKNDSVISERINYDLVKLFSDISDGTVLPQHINSTQ